ncbi:uncharacterized protein F4807DRAFT_353419 [Annulohypoxylon truncatum]|uniref:uncharacterized protein n=1 Tax=Annulohypoxylon truncatum TaxID=327061 RepID=UPI0020089289|nr:uncharacterized protein F4807DRAFT_353419 [Annulohypoxylon truncatum]KAI1204289.1 hypothetical protein F4807DRAFT_353419 [Annulohypoxylon truncatum]
MVDVGRLGNLNDIPNFIKIGNMGTEDPQFPFSTQTTLVRSSSFQTLGQSDSCSPAVSTIDRTYSQVGQYAHRSSRLKRQYQIRSSWRRKPKLCKPPSDEGLACSRCLSTENQNSGDRCLEHVLQRLEEMDMRQERLLNMLQRANGNNDGDFGFPFSPTSANLFQPRLDVFSSSSLQKYLQITLRPDPVRLCDMFLARYNLPHILTGSYDPIELMHAMHGWEQERYGDIVLIVQQHTDDDSHGIEVPWKPINQTEESLLALKVTQVVSLIKENWLYQGRSIRNPDEPDVPFETDEFADSVLFLNCPGYTKALLYQSSYDSSGAHFSREPWLSGKRSLLCQLQVTLVFNRQKYEADSA